MNDEMFRLTAVDLRQKGFTTKLRGYPPQEVDDYLRQVADELERLARQNQELGQKVKLLTEQLQTFRERDKALNDALVSAQQLRSEVREQSERESQLILREARGEAERIIQAARVEAMRVADRIDSLARMRHGYLKQFRVMLERQLAEIAAEEDVPDPDPRTLIDGDDQTQPPTANPRSGALFRG